MTENANRVTRIPTSPLSIANLVDNSLKPGGSISLSFSDGIVNVTLDQMGDWTITAGLSARSDRALSLERSLEQLGFFRATENEGLIYLLWTSALQNNQDGRGSAEEKLLKVLKCFHSSPIPNYIG